MSEKTLKRGEIYWVDLPDKGSHELKDRHYGSDSFQQSSKPR